MSDFLFCLIRQSFVVSTPEEKVRQHLLKKMIDDLGYPLEMIAVEKGLSQMSHLVQQVNLPKRRADVIVFGKNIHPLYSLFPLLLIECKAVKLKEQTLRQIAGYNHYVQAPFLCVVNQNECLWGYFDSKIKDFSFTKGLASYKELLQMIGIKIS